MAAPRIHPSLPFILAAIVLLSALPVEAQRGRGRQEAEVTTVDSATAGTVKGKVLLLREPPTERPIRMDADPVCAAQHDGPVDPRKFEIGDNGEVQHAFVFVSQGLEGMSFPVPVEEAVLDQHGCMYDPPVWGMMVDQKLAIVNSDPTLHNVHAITQEGDAFNLAMPTKGLRIEQRFREPAVMVKVKCDVHPWMFAYCGVLPHPYYDTTDETGTFEIPNLPPGNYTVTVWHRAMGAKSAAFTLGESQTVELAFEYGKN